jgi:arginyl-tRNA--protein-N-Asp/Glu arginylyltransferase
MNQQTGLRLPSFFITEPAPCPYITGQMERKLFTHLAGSDADTLNNTLTHAGFRRSQSIAYRPACDTCSACQSVRILIEDFTPSASFRRLIRKNSDLTGELCPPRTGREQYDLLRRYLDARHENGGMADMTPGDYVAMVEETAVDTFVMEYRTPDGDLLACLLGDRMQDGISLVYSFFDPRADKRSLGSFMILDQIARAKEAGHTHIYLGYLIEDCRKMSYKKRFAPLQKLGKNGWEDYRPT